MIYFDNAATTIVNDEVLNSFNNCVKNYMGNSSSLHQEGLKASLLEKKATEQIASFFNAKEDEVYFTSGATESNNMAIKGVAFYYKNRGNHIITTKIEHLSVLNTFKQLEEKFGFEVTYLDVDENGIVDINELKNNIKDNTILVSIMAVNNEVGSIEPIEAIGKLLKNYPKIHFHVDATQAIGKIKINYDNVDLITLSGHKIHSFKASGLLIKRHNTNLEPLITGGGHQHNLRSGTTSVPIEVSLAKAIRLSFTNLEKNYLYVKSLQEYFFLQGSKINNLKFNSTLSSSPYIISFYTNKKASVVAEALSNKEIYVSTKSACSSKKESTSYVLEAMHKDKYIASNSIRVSFDEHNTKEEIDIFFKELEHILKTIK